MNRAASGWAFASSVPRRFRIFCNSSSVKAMQFPASLTSSPPPSSAGASAIAVTPALVSMPRLPTSRALQPFVFRTFGPDFLTGKGGGFFWSCSKNQSKAAQSCEKAAGCSWRQVLIVGKRRRRFGFSKRSSKR
jgi:hypothetical protein